MSKITEITEARQEQSTRLASLIDQTAAAFKELDASTGELRQVVFNLGKKPTDVQGTRIYGLDDLHPRVKNLVAFKLFGDPAGNTVNIVNAVEIENNSAIRLEGIHG